ncbi:MAG: acyl-CoA dehydrogenase family protein [Pseudonocardia sp.]|nr:acyl-CoA dehydrogenase family protein [Pseudonocardia sp.]
MNTELARTARAVFADHQAEGTDGLPTALWSALADLGLVQLTLPEEAGGSGGELDDLATVLSAAGEAAAPVPLAETESAGWLLHSAGLSVPAGPLAVVVDSAGTLTVRTDGHTVSIFGTVAKVGWARHATRLVLLTADNTGTDLVVSMDPSEARIVPGSNLAGEPRDEVRLHGRPVDFAPAPASTRELMKRRAALFRSLLLAGVASGALSRSIRYARERVQFGRPIAEFQAVQQQSPWPPPRSPLAAPPR